MSLSITFIAKCEECGSDLEVTSFIPKTYWQEEVVIKVEPCKECLDKAHAEGYERGQEEAT